MPPTLVIHFLSFLFINTITKKRGKKNHHFEEKEKKIRIKLRDILVKAEGSRQSNGRDVWTVNGKEQQARSKLMRWTPRTVAT